GLGIADEEPEPEPHPTADPQEMAELAERLRAAMDAGDLEQFGGLLHADARWAGCTNRGQVLDWYRALYDAGVRAEVRDVLVSGDVIVLELAVGGGAFYQLFRARDGVIVDISGYPDRAEALAALG
ncbi:MAG TPA: nuclear transport factor 2 family protein, partial [Pseudonocardiaceae bacterium]|nr:nuclear transport factor 2 family protein [Pseudonocardiaceae bacterium]